MYLLSSLLVRAVAVPIQEESMSECASRVCNVPVIIITGKSCSSANTRGEPGAGFHYFYQRAATTRGKLSASLLIDSVGE